MTKQSACNLADLRLAKVALQEIERAIVRGDPALAGRIATRASFALPTVPNFPSSVYDDICTVLLREDSKP